jgi:GT2 family glycosyltransferase
VTSVAVVIPTYNRAGQIGETIRSVLAQTLPPAEVVVVDDGSADDTEAVCAAFAPRVQYRPQANAGVSVARNRGVELTRSELIAFVDSDDLWKPDKLAIQVAALEAHPSAGWSITDCDVIDADSQVVSSRRGFASVFSVFGAEHASADELFGRYLTPATIRAAGSDHPAWVGDAWLPLFLGNFVLPSSAMVRREAFQRAGGFDPALRVAEDTEFFHRLSATSQVAIVMEPLIEYRMGQAGSLSSAAHTKAMICNALESLRRASTLKPPTAAGAHHFRTGQRRLLRKLAYLHLSQKERWETRSALRQLWAVGARDPWSFGVYAATWLPDVGFTMLHRLKRALRG